MDNSLNYLMEASIVLALLYGVYWLLLRTEPSFRFNRYYLMGSMVAALIIPLLSINLVINATGFPLNANRLPEFNIGGTAQNLSWWNTIDVYTSIVSIYLLGAFIFSIRFIYRMFQLRKLVKNHSLKYVSNGGYYLIETHGSFPTSSFMNYLFWDDSAALNESETEKIKQHELVHIRERHSVDLIMVEILKCAFWFNPFIYFFKNQLAMIHEYLADQKVLTNTQPVEYQQLILKQLFQVNPLAFSNPFNQSQILKRMKMMQSHKTIKTWKIAIAMMISIMVLTFTACEMENVSAQKGAVKVEGEIFQIVDNPATFVGGQEAFSAFLGENLKYPSEAFEDKTEGVVYVQFVLTKDGKLAEAQIKKGVSKELDAEALRVINKMPDWNPGTHNGVPVNTMFIVPIRFSLGLSSSDPKDVILKATYGKP